MGSLGAKRSRFFALTPSPSPTLWERGAGAHGGSPDRAFPLARLWQRDVGAHGGSPDRAFPLARPAGEGDTGGEGKPNGARGDSPVLALLLVGKGGRHAGLPLQDYFLRRRSASRLTSPLPNASMLAGSGTTS